MDDVFDFDDEPKRKAPPKKKPVEDFKSMILQSLALAFYNNAQVTFQVLEKESMTIPLF